VSPDRHPLRRLLVTGGIATALVATALAFPSYSDRLGSLVSVYDATKASAEPSLVDPESVPHTHNDPATKNAISRAGDTSEDTQDPTTAEEARAHTAYAAANRQTPAPPLASRPARAPRAEVPGTRYAMAGGCYSLGGLPIRFQATDLGSYLLYTKDAQFLAADGVAAEPSENADWTARLRDGRFTFRLADDRWLTGQGSEMKAGDTPTRYALSTTAGCARYPEAEVGISGGVFTGETSYQEVRGYVDAHTHGMAFEFLGGDVHCGRPWHRYGAAYALVDCQDHTLSQGHGAVLESILSGEPSHDPVGWPTFVDWPAPNSLTHEATYWKCLERSWRGGQRLFVNLLVENNKLCELYPIKHNSCDDMDSIRLQAKRMYQLQDYIDAQYGGPGRGFYRIVTSPWEARRVINAGQMAIIMGIETSVPFGCTFKTLPGGDVPACDPASIDRQLDEVHKLGVRQMELVNKFDNALSGVAGDNGEVGVAVNSANFLETGSYWDMEHCEPEHPDAHDKNQLAAPDISAGQQDALFGAIGQLFNAVNLPALPLYPTPDHCNNRGLTTLGEHVIDGLAKRHMLFDPDHMSVKARNAALDQIEAMGYSGVLSSHSWATEDAYPRIYEMGGYIAPYAGDSTGFVEKWRKHLEWADPRFYFGFGYGADMNGLGAQGDPRGADVPNPVTYPFEGYGGVRVMRQVAGERTWDINVDGVAQYGLYPDWIEDLRQVAGADGDAIVEDMARGAEAYLQTWERAEGIAPDSCRNPDLRESVGTVRDLVEPGMTTRAVMEAVGQPYLRSGHSFVVCAAKPGDREVRVRIIFSDAGRVTSVRG